MLRDEILEALDIFDECGISEDDQRTLFKDGLYFNYTYGDPDYNHENRHLDALKVATLIKTLKAYKKKFEVNDMLYNSYKFCYGDLVREIADMDGSFYKIKRLGR